MFRAVLYAQWKWGRLVMLPAILVAGFLPLWALRSVSNTGETSYHIPSLMASALSASGFYQVVAVLTGVLLAALVWQTDTLRQHVYALSLPVPRWKFVLLRFGAGATLLGIVAACVGLFAAVATALAPLPSMLHAYPLGLAVRFWLGSLVSFSTLFPMAGGNPVRVKRVLAVIATVVVVDLSLAATGITRQPEILLAVGQFLFDPNGPLVSFFHPWMLLDV
jgi:hypothetical protein